MAGPPRRDPLFLGLCVFAVLIAETSARSAFMGVQLQRLQAAAGGGQPAIEWLLLGLLFGGIAAYFLGRQAGLALGGVFFASGAAPLLAAPGSPAGLAVFTLGQGLVATCSLVARRGLAAERTRQRAALAFFPDGARLAGDVFS